MNALFVFAGGVIGFLIWWGASELLFRRKERRKNIRFHDTLDRIVSSNDPDEIIAIRDAYRNELDL